MSPLRTFALGCLAGGLLVLAGPAGPAVARPAPATSLIAQHGFGDDRNVYAWSMEWFEGRLYVGTAREEACVENITVDFFLRVSQRYLTRPLPGVRCPADPYDMDLRAEIWRYTPQTGRWDRVYRSPETIPNPRAKGKAVPPDIAFRGMVVDRHAKGGPTLYVGDVTADEYLPELKRDHPPRILATRDGRRFRAIAARDVVVRVPYGDFRPMGVRSMQIWRGELYVTLTPGLTGDGAIFHVKRPWSRHPRFKQVTPKSMSVFETEVYAGDLYAGTGDREKGYGVWRIGGRPGHERLHALVTGGAGRGPTATSVVSMHVFRDRLYVGASGWYNETEIPISELIRLDRRGDWQLVSGAPRAVGDGVKRPISALGDGFGNIFAAHFWRMQTFHGTLYVGTNDWSWIVQSALPGVEPWVAAAVQSALRPEMGFDLWSSCNGRDWYPVTQDAFGANAYDFGARNLVTSPQALYVGSANHAQGTKIWRTTAGSCDGLTSADRRAAPPMPAQVDGVARRRSNVVSWDGSPGAASYRVLRASYDTVTLSVVAPPTLLSGFRLEEQMPTFVTPGTPGSTRVELPVFGVFEEVATTAATTIADPVPQAGEPYVYQVVAEGPTGAESAPSQPVVAAQQPVPTAPAPATEPVAPVTTPPATTPTPEEPAPSDDDEAGGDTDHRPWPWRPR